APLDRLRGAKAAATQRAPRRTLFDTPASPRWAAPRPVAFRAPNSPQHGRPQRRHDRRGRGRRREHRGRQTGGLGHADEGPPRPPRTRRGLRLAARRRVRKTRQRGAVRRRERRRPAVTRDREGPGARGHWPRARRRRAPRATEVRRGEKGHGRPGDFRPHGRPVVAHPREQKLRLRRRRRDERLLGGGQARAALHVPVARRLPRAREGDRPGLRGQVRRDQRPGAVRRRGGDRAHHDFCTLRQQAGRRHSDQADLAGFWLQNRLRPHLGLLGARGDRAAGQLAAGRVDLDEARGVGRVVREGDALPGGVLAYERCFCQRRRAERAAMRDDGAERSTLGRRARVGVGVARAGGRRFCGGPGEGEGNDQAEHCLFPLESPLFSLSDATDARRATRAGYQAPRGFVTGARV
ncbi:unnamed protein product, partial [Pelagomonas calceolata]